MNGTALYRALVHAGAPEDEAKEAADGMVSAISVDEKISAIDKKFEAKIDALDKKIDAIDKKFEVKIDTLDKKFEANIDALDKKFEAKIDAIDKKFEAKIDALDKKFEAMFKINIGISVAIFLLMLKMAFS